MTINLKEEIIKTHIIGIFPFSKGAFIQQFMQDFSVKGVQHKFGGRIFSGRDKMLLFVEPSKFGVIFQNMSENYKKYEIFI